MALTLPRRSLLASAFAAPALLPLPGGAQTALPDRGLRILVGFQANGGTDIVARAIATQLQRRLGRHVLVENKPGDSGAVPGELVKKGSNDGTTLAFLASTTLVSRRGQADFPFNPLVDLAPISLAGNWPMGLAVSPKLGVSTFPEYLQYLKSDDPDRHKLGTTASDAFVQAFNLMFSQEVGVTMKGVPFRGAAAMVGDLAEGRIPAAVSGIVSLLQHHRGGRLKLLMTTGDKRLAVAKDIPTARELGYGGLEVVEWFAYFARAGTAASLIAAWNNQIRTVLDDRNLQGELAQIGLDVESSTPQEVTARIISHQKAWKARMEAVGMRPVN
ncbi:tripartite tricarboxylate transporter substrate binding protein [soil metagenome]